MKTHTEDDIHPACPRLPTASSYLLGELDPEENRAFEAHLSACPVCAKGVEDFRQVIRQMKPVPSKSGARDLADRVLARLPADAWAPKPVSSWTTIQLPAWAGIAAVFLVAVGLCAFLLMRGRPEDRMAGPGAGKAAGERLSPDGTKSPARACELAYRWLQENQRVDGGWTAGQAPGSHDYSIGVSSLALLAFMDRNADVFRGRHADTVRRGIGYLVANQDEGGLIGPAVSVAPYNHGLATVAILDACAVESNAVWKAAGERAIQRICASQLPSGGWGYLKSASDSANTSASIWPLLALLRADAAGVSGLRPSINRGLIWLQSAVNQDGFMGYSRTDDFPYGQETMTAAGVVCFLTDKKGIHQPAIRALIPALRKIAAKPEGRTDFYRLFFVAEAVTLSMERESVPRRDAIIEKLAALQEDSGSGTGSWAATDPWGDVGGRVYSTAMATLAMNSRP